MTTELGRIAALTEWVGYEESPLERQVRRVAWLIAIVATMVGLAFLPISVLAGLPLQDVFVFAVGLLVANVPEGLLPTVTLALAMAVRGLARRGALVRRLNAVETLGCTDVICTDETGTLTCNRTTLVVLLDAQLRHDQFAGFRKKTGTRAAPVSSRDAGLNVRKSIPYIFAHAIPEVVPFLLFAFSGGIIPLPLTVLQIFATDLGTETFPELALGREPAEPGLMRCPPRDRGQSVITDSMLLRAWGLLGGVSAALVLSGFFFVLVRAGWHPGAPTGPGTPLHDAYLWASTITFAGNNACKGYGRACAERTKRASLWQV